jgi:hypothetical protein
MKPKWNYSNYGNDLRITLLDAKKCSHAGQCDNDVLQLMQKPYIKKQLATLDPLQLSKELNEYGAWDEIQLSNHQDNLMRWVWISCCDILERS